MRSPKDAFFDIVAILELYENGLATSDMLASELRSIRNDIGEQLPAAVRTEASQRAAKMAESAAAQIL